MTEKRKTPFAGRVYAEIRCSMCGELFRGKIYPSEFNEDKSSNKVRYCQACKRENYRKSRGKTVEEVRAEASLKACSCRILSKEETDVLRDIYLPPKKKARTRTVLPADR